MWRWECELVAAGFRQRSEQYWQCERGYRLPEKAYVSVFVHAAFHLSGRQEHIHVDNMSVRAGRRKSKRRAEHIEERLVLEVSAFHVTFLLGCDHIHFYYHEI